MPQATPLPARPLVVGVLVVLFIVIIAAVILMGRAHREPYSVGYQIGPHYLGTSTWKGTPYALSDTCPGLGPGLRGPDHTPRLVRERFDGGVWETPAPDLVYQPPITDNLRGAHADWWRPDGGTYGLPPAAERPDFWAGDPTIHTYLARDPIPPLCRPAAVVDHQRRPTAAENVEEWRYWGGPKGWNYSPFY